MSPRPSLTKLMPTSWALRVRTHARAWAFLLRLMVIRADDGSRLLKAGPRRHRGLTSDAGDMSPVQCPRGRRRQHGPRRVGPKVDGGGIRHARSCRPSHPRWTAGRQPEDFRRTQGLTLLGAVVGYVCQPVALTCARMREIGCREGGGCRHPAGLVRLPGLGYWLHARKGPSRGGALRPRCAGSGFHSARHRPTRQPNRQRPSGHSPPLRAREPRRPSTRPAKH